MPKLYELLETKDRKLQEARVQQLLEGISAPMVAITITLQGNRADFGVVGNPEPQALLQALDVVRDNILAMIVRQQDKEQGEPPNKELPMDGVSLNDSEVPDYVMPDGPDGGDFSS